jgi:hypothetical protein
MSWSDDAMVTAFDSEVGVLSTLATAAQKIQWWNEGQARLGYYLPSVEDVTWAVGDRSIALPAGFVRLDKLVTDDGDIPQPWRVYGSQLVMDDPIGATAAGGARLYYHGEFTPMTTATTATELTTAQDHACLYYALSRFHRLLSASRAYYKRYATIVGQNASTVSDLQQEAERYYQDYLDAREDIQPLPPAHAYNG